MSGVTLINTCTVCGAEEALDNLLARMIDDDQVRRLLADVLTQSLPIGGLVVSYLRMHKPARQRLRMAKVATLLAELVPDIRRGAVTRKGREWAAPIEAWRHAFAAVFEARDKGTLELPLEGNGYLYEVLLRQADKAEGAAEREREQAVRARPFVAGPQDAGGLLSGLVNLPATLPPALKEAPVVHVSAPPAGPSAAARKIQAEIAAKLGRRPATTPQADDSAGDAS